MPSELNLDRERIVRLLDDPRDYHWAELTSTLLGALATVAANPRSRNRLRHFQLEQVLDFVAYVFAAKWILNLPDNSLEPIEERFSFPSDVGWLEMVMIGFGQITSGRSDFSLPWPSGFSPDEYARGGSFEDEVDAWFRSLNGVLRFLPESLESDPSESPQDCIDRTIRLTGGYPLPHSVHDLDRLVELTSVDAAEAMSWVWADQWSPERLASDVGGALVPLRNALDSALLDTSELGARVSRLMVLDLIIPFRKLFKQLLRHRFGDDWLRDAVPINGQKELLDRWVDRGRKGSDFD